MFDSKELTMIAYVVNQHMLRNKHGKETDDRMEDLLNKVLTERDRVQNEQAADGPSAGVACCSQ